MVAKGARQAVACALSLSLAAPAPATTQHRPPPGWSVARAADLPGGIPYVTVVNAGTDGSAVAARFAGAIGGVSDTRALALANPRPADRDFAADVASIVASRYASAEGPLLNISGPVVVSSSHRAALYAAEALHAPLLPAQTLAYADTLEQACDAASAAGAGVLVGADYDYDGLWLWIKPRGKAGVPPAHRDALRVASELVIMRTTDPGTFAGALNCSSGSSGGHGGGGGVLAVHSSLPELAAASSAHPKLAALWAQMKPHVDASSTRADGATLRQWELGLPDETVAAYRAAWASLGRPASAVTVLEGPVVDGYEAVPAVWRAYLEANGARPRGVQVESYWVAQPSLARADASLPVPSYALYKPDWHPLLDAAAAALGAVVNATSAADAAKHTRAFVNRVGSSTDVEGVERLYAGAGVAYGAWASVGLDCPPAVCRDVFGEPVPPPHEHAAAVLAANASLLPPRRWRPLAVAAVAAAMSPHWMPPPPPLPSPLPPAARNPALLPSPPAPEPVLKLHVLDTPGAVCLDGTPGAFYVGTPATPTTKWLIWGEGKAWCLSDAECAARAQSADGRGGWGASGWPAKPGSLPPTLPWGDAPCLPGKTPGQAWGCQLSNNCSRNPALCAHNMVYLKTCDGGSWTGNRSAPVAVVAREGVGGGGGGGAGGGGGGGTTLHYRGRTILDAVAAALAPLGIGDATEVVVGGGSAGALGVYLNLDHWNRTLNPRGDKRFFGLPDCGFFQDWGGAGNAFHRGFGWMASAGGMSSAVDPSCRAANAGEPGLCLMAEHLAPFIRTPLLALQAKFDAWQLPNICGGACATDAGAQAYGDALVRKLQATVLASPGNAAVVDSCRHHCGGYDMYVVDNFTQAEAVRVWLDQGAAALPNAGRLLSNATYPCARCCDP